ncbi:hypothetical protein AAZX31_08G282600 [Glycine max]
MGKKCIVDEEDCKCVFCNRCEETANNCFFTREGVVEVWKAWYWWLDIKSVLPNSLQAHMSQHDCLLQNNKDKERWMVVWVAIVWNIWLVRNDLMQRIAFTTWSWLSGKSKSFNYSFTQWMVSPGACITSLLPTEC